MSQTLTLPSGNVLHYQLERRQRRTVGLKITATGLVVHAPKQISQTQLENLISAKETWIHRKLATLNESQPIDVKWQEGEKLLFLGQEIILTIQPSTQSKATKYTPGLLQLTLAQHAETKTICHKVTQWYKKQALIDFSRRLEIFAVKLNVALPRLFLSNARLRWGSCNTKKEIRLNWRLLQAPPHIINYVICHELAHLREMNHSKKFWATVALIYPDFKLAEKELKILSPQLRRM